MSETLIEAGLDGPRPDAQRLLISLVSRDLTQDGWLTVQKGLAVTGFAGPEPVTVAGLRHDEAARLPTSTVSRTGDLLRSGRLWAALTRHTRRVDRKAVDDRKVDTLAKAAKGRRGVLEPAGEPDTRTRTQTTC